MTSLHDFIRALAWGIRNAALHDLWKTEWVSSGRNAEKFIEKQEPTVLQKWERFKDSPMSRQDFVRELETGTDRQVGFNQVEEKLFKK